MFKQPLGKEDLRRLLAGRPAATIFAARSPTVKKLGLTAGALDDEQMLDLMARYPQLIRRPLLVHEDELIVGFDIAGYTRLAASGSGS